MRNLFSAKNSSFLLLFMVVFASRLPFLSEGYGVEEDSWGIALAAFHTKLSGIYEPSRFPGHPVHELILSALWGAGPVVYNGLSAVFSAIGVLFFSLILKQLNFKHYLLAAYTLAFIPVYYISSTYTIDFLWTEALVLISFYLLLKNNFIWCGIVLGLAIGCRITSGAMLLPFTIILWQHHSVKQSVKNIFKIAIPMLLVTIFAFTPLIKQFGFSFFMYYDQFPYPPITKVLYKMTIGAFGLVGIVAIIYQTILYLFSKDKTPGKLFNSTVNNRIIYAAFLIIILYTIAYLRLPQKSGYMMPVIPFIVLLIAYFSTTRQFITVCVLFIVSSFVFSINLTDKLRGAEFSKYAFRFNVSGQEIFFDPITGPLFSDYSKRKQKSEYSQTVIEKAANINQKTVIIAGWWYNEIMVESIEKSKNNFVTFESYINASKLNNYLAEGYKIEYLPEQNIYNDLMYKMQITDSVSVPF